MSHRLLIALLAASCESATHPAVPLADAGRAPMESQAPDARAPDTAMVDPPRATACPPPAPARQGPNGGEVVFPIELRAGGKPMRLGQEATRKDGVAEKFTLFHAFLAEPFLLEKGGGRVPAQLSDGQGRPLPYGLLLVDPEKVTSVALLAPPGSYAGLELGVGVPALCNAGDPTKRSYPLSADGDMYWSWGSQYLFVRLEGFVRGPAETAWGPYALHMGFDQLYRRARLMGPVTVGTGTAPTIVFDIDGLIQPDGPGAEPSTSAVTPDWVADHISGGAVLSFE
jgi:hypothetical protein